MTIEAFLAEIERRAYRMALFATKNHDDALDIVQDAMFTFVTHYAKEIEGVWKSLFYRVLESKILDWHRRQSVRNRFRLWMDASSSDDESNEDNLLEQLAVDMNTPELSLSNQAFIQCLNATLDRLPIRQQQVFMLRIWEGLDIRETAIAMQCSESSVKTHYARALEKCREQLQEFQP